MRTSFESLSDQSRIWIFQSSVPIIESDIDTILKETDQFLQQWAAHGSDLMASTTIKYQRFLIVAIDEGFNMASGCSIDSMTRFVQGLGEKYNLNFFHREKLAFIKKNEVILVDMKSLRELVSKDFFDSTTTFFNNNIQVKGQLKNEWLVNPEESWLKRYFQPSNNVL